MNFSDTVRRAKSWTDIHRRLLPHNEPGDSSAGLMFEQFCRAYFLAEPSEQREFQKVWHHSKLPPKIRKKLTINQRDHGVDLVLQHRDGRYFGVQCKFKRDQSASLSWTKDRLTSWLSEADECDGLILFTNASNVDAHTLSKCRKKDFRLYTLADLLKLESKTVAAILTVAKGRKPKALPRAKPRPYQKAAIRDVVKGFKDKDRGQLILPCGAGKTLTALWAKESLKSKRTLVLVPSLALLRQTKREWSTHQRNWIPYLCVCSEKGIDKDVREDRLATRTHEIHGNVTTDAKEIRAFARKQKELIIYSTYQSLDKVIHALKPTKIEFDLVLCDEAHKTAGSKQSEFALVHDAKKIRAKRRLYMTATPRVTSKKLRDRHGDETFKLLADMSDPTVFGPILHQMTFGAAIAKKILVDYEIVVIGVSDREIKKAIARRAYAKDTTLDEIANNLALAKVMKKYGASHAITFHSSIKRAQDFRERHDKHYPRIWTQHVNGKMSTNDRESLLHEFRDEPNAVLTNARCLTEGIDVPAIDCVYFCDPKSSKVDIVQASGRALRQAKHKNKQRGHVVVPVFHRNKKKVDAAIDKSVFRHVVDVVRALADQDERIEAEIHALIANKGRRCDGKARIKLDVGKGRIHLVGFEKALKQALFDQIVEKSTTTWDARVIELLEYKKRFGTLRVPRDAKPPWDGIGRWVDKVRADERNGRLKQERIRELRALGFDWKVDGETLDDTTGLLNEAEFIEASGLWMVASYRTKGLIAPIGYAMAGSGLSAFYHPSQVKILWTNLGITLNSTEGLLNEAEFAKQSGLTNARRYRLRGMLTPVGFSLTNAGLSPFYRPSQAETFRKKLGITLRDTADLLNEKQFMKASGFSNLAKYRRHGLIQSVGIGLTSAGPSHFYHPRQIEELKRRLGITLNRTKGLLNEKQFRERSGLSKIGGYRKRGLITPVGYALNSGGVGPYYAPAQANELKRKLGITLASTKGLLSEQEFINVSGLSQVARYRKKGLIKPVGFANANTQLSAFYRPTQILRLKKKLGVTLDNTEGLLVEGKAAATWGISRLADYRKQGHIKPAGFAITNSGLCAYYRPSQARNLKRNLGITLENTKGLLTEAEFRKASGFSCITKYRKRGIIEPVGYGLARSDISAFYRRSQIAELRQNLGITLDITKGLLNEKQFKKASGLSNMASYRQRGLVKPAGYALSSRGLSAFYHPSQIEELRKRLGITLDDTTGLLSAEQFANACGVSTTSIYRWKDLVKPKGYAMRKSGLCPFYHPSQVDEMKQKLSDTRTLR